MLLLAVLSRSWTRQPTAAAAARVTLRLIPALAADRQQPKPPAAAPASPRRTTSPAPAANRDALPIDAATAINAPSDSAGPPAPPASQPPPLDLTLRRGSLTPPSARSQALEDPRTNTPRTTPEQRLSTALDTRVIEEDLADGRKRFRRGASCIIVTPSRGAQLNPFDEGSARMPSLVSACP